MVKRLRIWTSGGLRIELDGEPLSGLPSRKAEALLVYLAVTGRPHPRDHLATLLWDNRSQARSMGNLSVVLSGLRKRLSAHMAITRQDVGLEAGSPLELDVAEFQARIQAAQQMRSETKSVSTREVKALEAAVEIFSGNFLTGFHIRGAREFEEWVLLERERLQWLLIEAYETLIISALHGGAYRKGIAWAQECLKLDPLREKNHRNLILLLARNGQWSAAIAQYKACQQILASELGVEPTLETTSLHARILAAMEGPRHNLPSQATPFIGREQELAQIGERMAHPDCRLLTLLGPGGIGKTRLALQFGETQLERYLNGIYAIPLASVNKPDHIVSKLAEAINLQFQSHSGEVEQLVDYLREKEMLLILDNFEHLLGGADLVTKIVREAPLVNILTTSRERLNLREEWVVELGGLPYPSSNKSIPEEEDDYEAVRLFLQHARQVKSGYTVGADERASIARICQMVEGMPLGIELAAAWVRVLSPREIAHELQGNLDLLHSRRRDMPARHQHIHAVFDHSWDLLSEADKQVFRRLSVFHGGFDREAARQIAGATLDTLSSLADKSLIRTVRPTDPSGTHRYEIHELLRQYAAGKLIQQEEDEIHALHNEYFARWLLKLEADLWGQRQNMVFQKIGENIENIRAAWQYAHQNSLSGHLAMSLTCLNEFYSVRGWFQEGEETFALAISDLSESPAKDEPSRLEREKTLGRLFVHQGIFCAQTGEFDRADDLLNNGLSLLKGLDAMSEIAIAYNGLGAVCRMRGKYHQSREYLNECLAIYQQLDKRKGIADARNTLGSVAYRLSEYDEARDQYSKSLDIRRELGDQKGMARCMLNLGTVHYRQGEYSQAIAFLEEAITLCHNLNDKWGLAASFNNLGNVEEKLGHYDQANKLYADSLAIKREIGHRKGVASTLYNIGKVAFSLQEFHKAKDLFSESVTQLDELGDKWSLSNGLAGLGRANMTLGLEDESERNYRESLTIAREIEAMILIEQAIVGFAELKAQQGDNSAALELAAHLILRPPRAKEVLERAEGLSSELEEKLSPDEIGQARRRARSASFDQFVSRLLTPDP